MSRNRTLALLVTTAVLLPAVPAAAQEASGELSVLSGRVSDDSGTGLANVCVTAWDASPVTNAEMADGVLTDDSGDYALRVPPGDYRVGFFDCDQAPIYAWEWWQDAGLYSTAGTVSVVAGQDRAGVDSVLAEGTTVHGLAVDVATGEPIEGACAVLLDEDYMQIAVGLTDATGDLYFDGVRPGEHQLVWGDCNDVPVYAVEWHGDAPNYARAKALSISATDGYVGVYGQLHRAGSLTGRVSARADGRGAAQACVVAFDDDGIAQRSAVSGTDGAYEVDLLRPGAYRVGVYDCADEVRFGQTWFGGADEFEQAQSVVVGAGGTTSGVDIALDPAPAAEAQPASTAPPPAPDGGEQPAAACPDGQVPDSGFSDVAADSTHKASIDCVVWKGIANGRTSSSYAPGDPVNRAQMASFLVRLMDLTEPVPATSESWFDDIAGSPHADSIRRLAAIGIVRGTGDRTYSPGATVTRAQMASFLVRAYEHLNGEPVPAGGDRFSDDDANVHEANIDKAVEAGLARGLDETRYGPDLPVRRDQMATFLARTLERLVDDGHLEPASLRVTAWPNVQDEAPQEVRAAGSTRRAATDSVFTPLSTPAEGDITASAYDLGTIGGGLGIVVVVPAPPAVVNYVSCWNDGRFQVEMNHSNQGPYFVQQWHAQIVDGQRSDWRGGSWVRLEGQFYASSSNTTTATFTGLAPGQYAVYVQVSYPDGRVTWQGELASYAHRLYSSFHQRWFWYGHWNCDVSSTGGGGSTA